MKQSNENKPVLDQQVIQVSEALAKTPQVLNSLLRDLPEPWTHATEGADTWSPLEVVGHLIWGELDDWIVRAKIILSDAEDKRFQPFDRLGGKTMIPSKSLRELLTEFQSIRIKNLNTLNGWQLDAKMLERTGIHPEFGEVTLRQLLSTWLTHDYSHIVQIVRVLAKQLKEDAGPWVSYISVLRS